MNVLFKYILILALLSPSLALACDLHKTSMPETVHLLFVNGQRTGLIEISDPHGNAIREALNNIRAIVEKNGATMNDVVKLTIYLADSKNDYPLLRGIVSEYFNDPSRIARSVVGVSRIPDNNAANFNINRRVEIDAVVAVKSKR